MATYDEGSDCSRDSRSSASLSAVDAEIGRVVLDRLADQRTELGRAFRSPGAGIGKLVTSDRSTSVGTTSGASGPALDRPPPVAAR